MVSTTAILGGGALIGFLYSLWNYIKLYLVKIYGLIFVRILLNDDELRKAASIWILNNTKSSKLTLKTYWATTDYVKPVGKNQVVSYEVLPQEPTIFWYKKKPFIFTENKITFIRWMFNSNDLINEIVDYYNTIQGDRFKENRFFIRKYQGTLHKNRNGNYSSAELTGSTPDSPRSPNIAENSYTNALQAHLTPTKWKKEEVGQIKRTDPLDHLSLSEDCMQAIDEIRRWRYSAEWYKERLIPHRRGITLFGKPGTGKTSVAKSLAMELNLPIMIFDLSNMSNSDFSDAWDSAKNNAPCMVLLEDLDAIFDGRKNTVHTEGGLSFDCLLNCIDGVQNADGILLVVTTNNIDKIDSALGKPNGHNISTRPGRIDRAIELLSPDEIGRRKIANRILCDFQDKIEDIVVEGQHDTGAQFQERCSRLALKLFWDSKNPSKGN